MGGASKKRKSRSSSSNTNKNDNTMWNSSGSSRSSKSKSRKSSLINENAAGKLFEKYADPEDSTIMNMEGISTFCEDLNIDPLEDVTVLVLLWKMVGASATQTPAQLSNEEWMSGCNNLQVDSLSKFKELLPSLDMGFLDQQEFKELYKFCFQFNRQGTHRTLDVELVIMLLQLIFSNKAAGSRIPADRLETFTTFLEKHKEQYSRVTLDQWVSFLDFCYECEDLSSYDEENSAWPVLIDEYVEYMMEQQTKK